MRRSCADSCSASDDSSAATSPSQARRCSPRPYQRRHAASGPRHHRSYPSPRHRSAERADDDTMKVEGLVVHGYSTIFNGHPIEGLEILDQLREVILVVVLELRTRSKSRIVAPS